MTKKNADELGANTLINRTSREVPGFQELIYRFERSISILGRSPSTFKGPIKCYINCLKNKKAGKKPALEVVVSWMTGAVLRNSIK